MVETKFSYTKNVPVPPASAWNYIYSVTQNTIIHKKLALCNVKYSVFIS